MLYAPCLFGTPAVYLPNDTAIPGISKTWYFGILGTLLNSCHSYSPAHAAPDVVCGPFRLGVRNPFERGERTSGPHPRFDYLHCFGIVGNTNQRL